MASGFMSSPAGSTQRLTESLAEALKPKGINVNAMLPSTFDTATNCADMPDADFSRWVASRDFASVVLFPASDAALVGAGPPAL